jgi:predicted RNA-binding protein Jag
MIDELREFIADTRQAAESSAAAHFGVPVERLEFFEIPASLRVAGLGTRVIVLAGPRQQGGELGDVGDFVKTMLVQLGLERGLRMDESEDEEGRIVVRVQSPPLEQAERKLGGVEASLAHLADRAAQRLIDEEASAVVVLARGAREGREGREPRGRDRDRGERGGRGRDRGRDRGAERGGDRGRDRDRGERGGRGRDRDRGGDRDRGVARAGSGEESELEALARRSAEEVRRSGEAKTLPPMSSRERWVVHNAIKDITGVNSQSVGEGDQKRVKIFPE